MDAKIDKRFCKAVRSSGLVSDEDLQRALDLQGYAAEHGRPLPLDRILLKLNLLDREQILGLWRALRYYVWRKEDKFYVKIAIQSKILTEDVARQCLKEQKRSYKNHNELVRVNEIARQRGYLKSNEDRAIVRAMRDKHGDMTLQPVDDAVAGTPFEPASAGAAPKGSGRQWKEEARAQDLEALKIHLASSDEIRGVSDEDLDALWDEADLDDVELDSQAVEIARAPLFDDSDDDDLLDLL